MEHPELDEVDRGILHLLQKDARNNTASKIADAVGVAPNTVRNRMERLEDQGILQGYYPKLDYEEAGYQLRVIFVCTVSVSDRHNIVNKALDIKGVIHVSETLSGRNNVIIEVVGEDSDDLTTIATQIEQLGCTIEEEWFMKNSKIQPFDHFRTDEVSIE